MDRQPPERENAPVTDLEGFHNAFWHFVRALEILSFGATEQCAAYTDFNVAWEIKDDVQAGKYLIPLGQGILTKEESDAIAAMASALDRVPASVLHSASDRVTNLAAMEHAVWQPLRAQAAALLQTLAALRQRNLEFLSPGHRAPSE